MEYNELQHKYDAILQMYGEKVEETQELQLDLLDVKEMYKAQIDELLKQQKEQKKSTSAWNTTERLGFAVGMLSNYK